jgi:hypothetical protein
MTLLADRRADGLRAESRGSGSGVLLGHAHEWVAITAQHTAKWVVEADRIKCRAWGSCPSQQQSHNWGQGTTQKHSLAGIASFASRRCATLLYCN